MGSYVRHFNKCGLAASGFDGNPSTPQLSKGSCSVLDLSVVADVAVPYDWVMSLEVHWPVARLATRRLVTMPFSCHLGRLYSC